MANVDVLVVAPYAPELEGLGSLLGRSLRANVQGMTVVAKSVGLGLPGVSGGTTQRLERLHPRALVLVGTSAAYPGRGLSPGQVVVADRAVVADAAVMRGWSSFPGPMTGQVQANAGLVAGLAATGARQICVASPCALTGDANLGAEIASKLQCDVEQSETFGVALACASYHVPFSAVLGISHEIGPTAQDTWRATHRAAAHAAATLIATWLRAGAVGVPHAAPAAPPESWR